MKSLKQVQEELAKELGYASTEDYFSEIDRTHYCWERLAKFHKESANRFAKEVTIVALIRAYNKTLGLHPKGTSGLFESAIINESNIPKI